MLKINIPENWAEKTPHPYPPHPPPRWGNFFLHWIYPFQAILSNFGFCGRKAPPPPRKIRQNIFTLDLSISGNFEQLWFLWQKSPPPPQDEAKFFYTGSIHFRQFWATLVFWQKSPPPPPMRTSTRTSPATKDYLPGTTIPQY